jgi:hypothetical protein
LSQSLLALLHRFSSAEVIKYRCSNQRFNGQSQKKGQPSQGLTNLDQPRVVQHAKQVIGAAQFSIGFGAKGYTCIVEMDFLSQERFVWVKPM